MRHYKNRKTMVCSHDGETDFFDIVAGVLQEDRLAPTLFIIYQDFLGISIDLMKENDLIVKKARSRWYQAESITKADYADDLALLTNTPT